MNEAHISKSLLLCIVGSLCALVVGCGARDTGSPAVHPFRDLEPIALVGESRSIDGDTVSLGALDAGDVLRIEAGGDDADAALLLLEDVEVTGAGLLAGGGPAGEPFFVRINTPGRYVVFVQSSGQGSPSITLSVALNDDDYRLPTGQTVRVLFADDFLTGPGLFDPESGGEEDLAFLQEIAPLVEQGILDKLREIFADTPVRIISETDDSPDDAVSTLTFLPDRVPADDTDSIDDGLTALDETRPECQDFVVFGELLPSGTLLDVGNQVPDDEAAVYVGSFQGRGETCQAALINSLNGMIATLAQVGAHEIGHLIGLYHVSQTDLMSRDATFALERDLPLSRGQVEFDTPGGVLFLPAVIQDPQFYFSVVFDTESTDGQL